MTAAAMQDVDEYLPVPPQSVRDDVSLRIVRTPSGLHEVGPDHDAPWVGWCRRIGTAALRHWGLPGLIDDAQLLTSELVTNALRYGLGPDIVVRFVITTDRLLIVVEDGSPDTPKVRKAAADDEVGRGMLLVSTLATRWGVSPDKSTTWCSLTIEE